MNEEHQGRFSDGCVKATFSALAFAALALGLAEKYSELYRFQPVGQYALGRELLSTGLSQLQEDPCWKSYASTIGDAEKLKNTSLAQLANISCDDSQLMTAGIGNQDQTSNRESKQPPPTPPASHGSEGASVRGNQAFVPAPPTIVSIKVSYPLQTSEILNAAVSILWDDKQLELAKKYSNSVAHEIYQWQRKRIDVTRARGGSAGAQAGPTLVAVATNNLTLADLELLSRTPRSTTLADFDKELRDNFRADLPNSSVGVTMGTASYATAFAIAFFMIGVAAYCKGLASFNSFAPSNTLLSLMFGTIGYELVLLLTAVVPLLSLVSLLSAIYKLRSGVGRIEGFGSTVAPVLIATLVSGVATLTALRHVGPHLRLTNLSAQVARHAAAAIRRTRTARRQRRRSE